MSYKLRVTSYELQATSYELRVMSYELQATSYKDNPRIEVLANNTDLGVGELWFMICDLWFMIYDCGADEAVLELIMNYEFLILYQ